MPEKELLDHLIARKLPWLFSDLGFRVAWFECNSTAFGNASLALQSDVFMLRFNLERGRIFAEVAPPSEPEHWWALPFVCQAISGELPVPELDGLASLLRNNYPAIVEALGPRLPETKRVLDQIAEQRGEIKAPLAPQRVRLSLRVRRMLRTPPVRLLGLILAAFIFWWICSR
jgi:hypothetical protein